MRYFIKLLIFVIFCWGCAPTKKAAITCGLAKNIFDYGKMGFALDINRLMPKNVFYVIDTCRCFNKCQFAISSGKILQITDKRFKSLEKNKNIAVLESCNTSKDFVDLVMRFPYEGRYIKMSLVVKENNIIEVLNFSCTEL